MPGIVQSDLYASFHCILAITLDLSDIIIIPTFATMGLRLQEVK